MKEVTIVWISLAVIVVSATIWFLVFSTVHPIASDVPMHFAVAQDTVHETIDAQIRSQLAAQYPSLPSSVFEERVQQQRKDLLNAQLDGYCRSIKTLAENLAAENASLAESRRAVSAEDLALLRRCDLV